MRAKVSKWGNSLAVRIPRPAAEAAGLSAGDEVEITPEGRTIRIGRAPRYLKYRTLKEMLDEAKRLGPENEPETVDWGPDLGAEILEPWEDE